jgi:hypothetical protein
MFSLPNSSFEFLDSLSLTWNDISWSYKNNILDLEYVEHYVNNLLNSGNDTDFNLSVYLDFAEGSEYDVASRMDNLFKILSENKKDIISKRWLYIILKYIYITRNSYENPFQLIDDIYADFDYPTDIESFVSYMPINENDLACRENENGLSLLKKNWERYLQEFEEENYDLFTSQ